MFHSQRRIAVFVLFLVVIPSTVYPQLGASLALRALRPLLSAAFEQNENIQDADPFVFSVIYFLEGKEQRAGFSFVEGLINNDINDREQVDRILNTVAGVSVGGGVALSLAGSDDMGQRLASFGIFVRANPYYSRWIAAIEAGQTVRVVNGELVISGGEQLAEAGSGGDSGGGYRETKENEVLPYLNLVHGEPGAEILVDGELHAVSTHGDFMFDGLPAGRHDITVRSDYRSATVQVFVNPGRQTDTGYDELELELVTGRFYLTVDPGIPGLPVAVDGTEVGVTPVNRVPVPAGQHEVSIESEWNDRVAWNVDGIAEADVVIDEAIDARGALRGSPLIPDGARVTVNGQVVELDESNWYTTPGRHRVTVTGQTFYRWDGSVTVRPGRATRLSPDLTFRTGAVELTPLPVHAAIALDGVVIPPASGVAEVLAETVIGDHTLIVAPLQADGTVDQEAAQEFRFSLSEGERRRISPAVGTVALENVPADVSVTIRGAPDHTLIYDGSDAGKDGPDPDLSLSALLPGTYALELTGDGYATEERVVTVDAAGHARVAFDARRIGELGIVFDSLAQYEIYEDITEEPVLASRARRRLSEELPEGEYLLLARRRDDIEWSLVEPVTVRAETVTEFRYDLGYSYDYQLREINAEIAAQERRMEGKGRRRVISFVGMGLTAVATATTELLAGEFIANYNTYTQAATTPEATAARADAERYQSLTTGGLVTSVLLGSASGILFVSSLGQDGVAQEIARLRTEEDRISRAAAAAMAENQARRALFTLERNQ